MLDLSIGNMSAYGIGLDEIMDAFGLEKKVDLNAKSSAVGGVSGGQKSKLTTAALDDVTLNQDIGLTTGKISIKVVKNGVEETLSFDMDLSALKGNAQNKVTKETLATEVAKQLNANGEFSKNFKATVENGGKLTFEAQENGGDILLGNSTPAVGDIGITFGNNTDNQAVQAQTNKGNTNVTKGHYGEIDFANLKDGDTITIAGKTYTKVADDTAVKDTYAGFKDIAGLKSLLADDGISLTEANNKITLDL